MQSMTKPEMNRRTGWNGSKNGLPPLEASPSDVQKSPKKAIRFKEEALSPQQQRQRPSMLPTLHRRASLLAYEPIMVRFVKNGDKFFEGVKINITQRTMRSWDTLLAELSRRIELPAGVRQVYTPERGHRVKSLSQLEHHKMYVCGSTEPFRKMDYERVKNPDWKTTNRIRVSDAGMNFPALSPFDPDASMSASSRNILNLNASMGATSRSANASVRSLNESELDLSAVRKRRTFQRQRHLHRLNSSNEPEVSIFEPPAPRPRPKPKSPPPLTIPSASKQLSLTIIRNSPPPRSRVSLLISKDTVKSWEEVKLLISENLKTVNGHLRLFSLEGTEVQSLSQMWTTGRTLIAAGNEKFDIVDFLMGSDSEQAKSKPVIGRTPEVVDNPPPLGLTGLQEPTPIDNPPPFGLTVLQEPTPIATTTTEKSFLEARLPVPVSRSSPKPESDREELRDLYESKALVESNSEPSIIAKDKAVVESNSEPSIIAKEAVVTTEDTTKESSGKELSNDDQHQADSEVDGKKTCENYKSATELIFSDSSSSPHHQLSLQESPQPYPSFPPSPSSNHLSGRKPRPKILSNLFEVPLSSLSSPVESPLLHAKHKSSLHKGFQVALLHPQTPQSEISVGMSQSVVEMMLSGGKETFSQNEEDTESSFSMRTASMTLRTIGIQTDYVDDHLTTIIEQEDIFISSEHTSFQVSQENIPSQTEDTIVQDLEASAAASQLHKLIKEKYNVGMAIAEGRFAVVKHCSDKEDNKEFLLRVIYKVRVFGKDDKILQEIDIMRMIRHENVLTVQDYWESIDEVCMVMEPIEGGDLFDAILYCQHLSESDAMAAMKQLGLALVYLHANMIVHRGIKPENVFLTLEVDGSWTLKLAGFSLATKMSEPLTLVCGNEYYKAPEMLTGKGYGTKADVWSAGVIAYILLSGIMPFRRRKKSRMASSSNVTFPSIYWENVTSDAKDFVCHLLKVPPQDRYSSSHLMQHFWFKKSFGDSGDAELSKKLIEYLHNRAAIKVAPVPMLTLTSLDHESYSIKKAHRTQKTNQQ